jgi:hypothetical protein
LTKLKVILFSLFLVSLFSCGKNSQATTQRPQGNADVAQSAATETKEKASFKPFFVYKNMGSPDNHYIASGWMPGPGTDKDLQFNLASTESPHSAETCIKIQYKDVSGNRWAGVYWQNPANNWGTKKGGFDLTGATRLKFWARGENGEERIKEFKVGGLAGEYPDSDTATIEDVILTKEWKEYTIDLRGKDLSYISGGFCWSTSLDVNPNGATFYLDDIVYE